MDNRFEFQRLFPNLQWEVIMKMNDKELVNLCRSSHAMETFCNTRNWFWKERINSKFGLNSSDHTVQAMVQNNGDNWFSVYLILFKLNKLKQKLLSHLYRYSLIDLYNRKSLNLFNLQLTEVPREIGNLTKLQALYLHNNNRLTKIPREIGNLTKLKNLSLSNNQLTDIPKEIGDLANLQFLILDRNQLIEIPKAIGNLTNLQTLKLDRNQLTELPGEIGNLTNLQFLNLNNNQLTELPREISNLTNLQTLYLENNQIIDWTIIKQWLPNVNLIVNIL